MSEGQWRDPEPEDSRLPDSGRKPHRSDPQPWWNDGDKVGGAIATTLFFGGAIFIVLVAIIFALKIGQWVL